MFTVDYKGDNEAFNIVGRAVMVALPYILGLPFLTTWIMIGFDYREEGGAFILLNINE